MRSAIVACLLAASCTPAALPTQRNVKVPLPPMRSEPATPLTPPGFPGVVLAEFASPEVLAPTPEPRFRFARNHARGLLATRSGGQWLVGPVRLDRDDASAIDPTSGDSGMRAIHPAPEGTPAALHHHADGFVLAWVEPGDGGWLVKALDLDGDGKPRGPARVPLRSPRPAQWLGLYGDGAATFLVHDGSRGPTHELSVTTLQSGVWGPTTMVDGGSHWNAAVAGESLWIAALSSSAEDEGKRTVSVARVGAKAAGGSGDRREIAAPGPVEGDVQIAALHDGALVAWNLREGADLHVRLARVGLDDRVGTAVTVDGIGSHALSDLVASGDRRRALVAFERVATTAEAERTVELVALTSTGAPSGARAALAVSTQDERVPRFFGDDSGFGALTVAPMKLGVSSAEVPAGPTVVRLDADLRTRASEPVRLAEFPESPAGQGVPVELRSPSCEDGLCTAIALSAGNQPLLALVKLPVRDHGWAPASKPLPSVEPPLAESLVTLAELEGKVADFAMTELADGRTMLAWVEDVPGPAPGDTRPSAVEQAGARLQLRFIERDGTPGETVTLSDKALSAGGVDVVPLPAGAKGSALVAWVGPNPNPQVFLTRVGAQGERLQQRTITRLPRLASGSQPPNLTQILDVGLVRLEDGNLVCAWSDTRTGEAEVNLARVSPKLERRGNELRVTTTAGASTEPRLWLQSNRLFVAWSETSPGAAQGDIQVATIEPQAFKLASAGRELARSAGHSRTPRFSAGPSGPVLSWMDEPTRTSAAGPNAPTSPDDVPGLRVLALDAEGQALAQLVRIRLDADASSSAAVRCDASGCRAVLVAVEGSEYRFDAAWNPQVSGVTPLRRTVARLPFRTQSDVQLHLTRGGDQAFFVEEGDDRTFVRAMRLRWSR
ncbi:MAG: hypothetical protein FJ096_10010 [Deltaproteobacteria bacterium]|nr:hypothetical protein [Deltaproteobacteria bacterium]